MSASVVNLAQSTNRSNDRTGRPPPNKLQPTAEQLRVAQISQRPDQDDDLPNKVTMVANLAGCHQDAAVFALHDCGDDVQQAVNMLLERDAADQHQFQVARKKKGARVGGTPDATSPDAADGSAFNAKDGSVNHGENAPDRGGRRGGRVLNAPPRMQARGSAGRGRTDNHGEYISQNDVKDVNAFFNNGDVDGDFSLQSRRGGRGRGRGGWRGARGSRNMSRPSRYERIGTAGEVNAQAIEGEGHTSARSNGSGENTVWEDVDEWTGSLKESQVFTARTLEATVMSPQLPTTGDFVAGATLDSTSQQPTAAHGSSLYDNAPADGSALVATAGGDAGNSRLPIASMADDLSQAVASATSVGGPDRVHTLPFSSVAVEQSLYMGTAYDRQLASDTIKHAIGIPTSVPLTATAPALPAMPQHVQNKVKPARTKLPPTKIPTAAVEMPHKAAHSIPVHVLGVQFGNLDLPTETSSTVESAAKENLQPLKALPGSSLQTASSVPAAVAATVPVTSNIAPAAVILQTKTSDRTSSVAEQQPTVSSSAGAQQHMATAAAQVLPQQAAALSAVHSQPHGGAQQPPHQPPQAVTNPGSQHVLLSPSQYTAAHLHPAGGVHNRQSVHNNQQPGSAMSIMSTLQSSLPVTSTAAFSSASPMNPAMLVTSSFSTVGPAGGQLYNNYLAYAQMPAGLGGAGYTGIQTPAYANLNYLAEGMYASQYYPDSGYDGSSLQPAGAVLNSTAAAGSVMQASTSTVVSGSTSAAGPSAATTASGSRMSSAGSHKPPAPGLPPGIGLPLPAAAAAAAPYMNMNAAAAAAAAASHMAAMGGGGPYFSHMYSYDDLQKVQLAYYDPSQYQLLGAQAGGGPGGAFAASSDGKFNLMDGQPQAAGSSSVQLSAAAQQHQPAGNAGAGGSGGMPLQQAAHYLSGSAGAGSGGGSANIHHSYGPYYYQTPGGYSPAPVFAGQMHSNSGLAAAVSGNASNIGFAKNSAAAYGSAIYAPAAITATGGGGTAYDDGPHMMQDYSKGLLYSSSSNQSSVKASAAGNGSNSAVNSSSASGDISSMYKNAHGMAPVAYTHAASSHMGGQAGGPMVGAYNPYMLSHQQQMVLQGSMGQESGGGGGRSSHAASSSAAGGSKSLGATGSKGSYSSSSAASWAQY